MGGGGGAPTEAITSLPGLCTRIRDGRQDELLDGLLRAIAGGKDDLREVGSIGLKTIVLELPATSPATVAVVRKVLPRLLTTLLAVRHAVGKGGKGGDRVWHSVTATGGVPWACGSGVQAEAGV